MMALPFDVNFMITVGVHNCTSSNANIHFNLIINFSQIHVQ